MRSRNILALLIVLLLFGGFYYFSNAPEPVKNPDPQNFVWMIEMDDIVHIDLSMPHEGLDEQFIKISEEDKFPWYFDDPQRSPIDVQRWGGGVTLLLSGPGADRVIANNASPETLREFGLEDPVMVIKLLLSNGREMIINVGDATPNGANYYVQAPSTNDVALVDASWYNVIAGLVTNPPHALAATQTP